MGDPKKKRKKYDTPRKKWDKQLLLTERKLVDFYGLKNKKELRKHETWLRNKKKIARGLLALLFEQRMTREKELMSGLEKIGLVKAEAILDDVLGLKVDELLEKRLQTAVLRKGLANTSKQARQFIIHGHIAIAGKKIDSPSYLVPVEKVSDLQWYGKPIRIEEMASPKKDLKKEFEKSAGIEKKEDEITETIDGNPKEETPADKKETKKAKEETVEEPKKEETPAEESVKEKAGEGVA